jgi:hypothetical protein
MWKIAKQTAHTQKYVKLYLTEGRDTLPCARRRNHGKRGFRFASKSLKKLEHVGKPGQFFNVENVESKKFTGMTVKMPVSTELSSHRFPHV